MKNTQTKSTQSKPAAVTNETFLVIVHDECGPCYGYELISAPDAQAAERVALDIRKAENEQSDLDDEEAGFEAILTFSRVHLEQIIEEMNSGRHVVAAAQVKANPEPEDDGTELPPDEPRMQ